MPYWIIGAFSAGMVVAMAIRPLAESIARKRGLLDIPIGRRQHEDVTPKAGGLIVGLGFCLLVAIGLMLGWKAPLGLLTGSVILLVLGLLDDTYDLPAIPRFAGQIAAGLAMTRLDGLRLEDMGNLLGTGPVILGNWAEAVTIFAVVGGVNCINMADGMDGLAGSLAVIALAGAVAILMPLPVESALLFGAVMGLIFGYLAYNHPRLLRNPGRKVFLGEAGSNLLGFWLAWLLVYAAERHQGFSPMSAVWLLFIPLTDTLVVMTRRLTSGYSPFRADRTHLHHWLLSAIPGGSRRVLDWLTGLALVGCVIAAMVSQKPWLEPAAFYLFISMLTCYFVMSWVKFGRQTLRGSRTIVEKEEPRNTRSSGLSSNK